MDFTSDLRHYLEVRYATAVILACAATTTLAQGPAVFGGSVVRDSVLTPIQGAEVTLAAISKRARTDEKGRFRIDSVPAGTHEVVVRYVGLSPTTLQISFAVGSVVEREILMRRMTVLDTVSVSATAIIPSFEENRAIGMGKFLTRADLAEVEQRKLGDILAQVRGVRILQGTGSKAWLYSGRRAITSFNPGGTSRGQLDRKDTKAGANPGLCYAQVYLNEAIVYRGIEREPLFDLNSVTPASIEAIEFYSGPALTPMRYSRMDSNCGVIVIHTRRTP